MKVIQQYDDNDALEQTTIYKLTLFEKLKFIIIGKLTIIYPLLKSEDILHKVK